MYHLQRGLPQAADAGPFAESRGRGIDGPVRRGRPRDLGIELHRMAQMLLALAQGSLGQHPIGGLEGTQVEADHGAGLVPQRRPARGVPTERLLRAGDDIPVAVRRVARLAPQEQIGDLPTFRRRPAGDERPPQRRRVEGAQDFVIIVVVEQVEIRPPGDQAEVGRAEHHLDDGSQALRPGLDRPERRLRPIEGADAPRHPLPGGPFRRPATPRRIGLRGKRFERSVPCHRRLPPGGGSHRRPNVRQAVIGQF